MKKIINQKRYDTDTARELAHDTNGFPMNDFHWFRETLYQKKTGEFFLFGEGNAASKYAEPVGMNSWSGGERIMPMSFEEAQSWAEEHLSAEKYEAIFGEVVEDDSKTMISLTIPAHAAAKLKQLAAKTGKTQSDIIAEMILAAE